SSGTFAVGNAMNDSSTDDVLYVLVNGALTTATVWNSGNQAPVAYNGFATTNEGTPVTATMPASDDDGQVLTYTVISGPSHGTLSGTGPSRTYTPAAEYSGSDSFTFKVND